MAVSTTDLMQKIYSVFATAYAARGNGTAFLAFEKLGVPLTDSMFKLNETDAAQSPALARERLTEIAIRVIEADTDSIIRTSRNVDAMVQLLLTEAMPLAPEQMALLGATKTAAQKDFDHELGSLDGLSSFHPINATPVDWYAAANAANWTSHTVGDHQATPITTPPAYPRVILRPPVWRVLPPPMHPALAHPVVPAHPLMMAAAAPHPLATPVVTPHPVAATPMARPAVLPLARPTFIPAPAAAIHPAGTPPQPAPLPHSPVPIVHPIVHPLIAAQAVASIHAAGTPQPVAATAIDISFDHCVVTLQWPWFPQVFLMDRGWYVPGYTKASFSNGTGSGDTGYLPVLASGFVVIRNLRISGQWTNQDLAAVQGSAAFGPFSLIGRNYDVHSGALSCPGMQIIGWFCEALPMLPPNSDPALIAAAAPPANAVASAPSAAAGLSSTPLPAAPPSATSPVSAPAATIPAGSAQPTASTGAVACPAASTTPGASPPSALPNTPPSSSSAAAPNGSSAPPSPSPVTRGGTPAVAPAASAASSIQPAPSAASAQSVPASTSSSPAAPAGSTGSSGPARSS